MVCDFRTCVKLDTLTQEQTHDLTLPLQGDYPGNSGTCTHAVCVWQECHLFLYTGTIHLLLTITGTNVQEVEGDTPLSTSWQSPRSTEDMKELMKKYVSGWL